MGSLAIAAALCGCGWDLLRTGRDTQDGMGVARLLAFFMDPKMLAIPFCKIPCTAHRGRKGGIFCEIWKAKRTELSESGSTRTSILATARVGGKRRPLSLSAGCGGSCARGRHICDGPLPQAHAAAAAWPSPSPALAPPLLATRVALPGARSSERSRHANGQPPSHAGAVRRRRR